MALTERTKAQITEVLSANDVVLFMKGNKMQPRCGFSATVVQILDGLGVSFKDVDVLSDPALRDGIKEFGNWPTIPQLYFRGALVGGCDIIKELEQTGELATSLGIDVSKIPPPEIKVSAGAAAKITEALSQAEPGQGVRIVVGNGGRTHELTFDDKKGSDLSVEAHGLTFLFDPGSARLAHGLSIDFVDAPDGGGFAIDNPNGPARVRQMTPQQLKEKLDKKQLRLYDVRTEQERAGAAIAGSIHLTDKTRGSLDMLPKDTVLVFHCHHGGRSQQAADHYAQRGFRNVYNLAGGIDAWSQTVDPTVKRY